MPPMPLYVTQVSGHAITLVQLLPTSITPLYPRSIRNNLPGMIDLSNYMIDLSSDYIAPQVLT